MLSQICHSHLFFIHCRVLPFLNFVREPIWLHWQPMYLYSFERSVGTPLKDISQSLLELFCAESSSGFANITDWKTLDTLNIYYLDRSIVFQVTSLVSASPHNFVRRGETLQYFLASACIQYFVFKILIEAFSYQGGKNYMKEEPDL